MIHYYLFLFILFFFSLPLTLLGQKQDNVWAFGYHNGIDFNSGQPVFWESNSDSWRKTGFISDENGNLLFYTDGATVYQSNGDTMQNGILDNPLIINASPSIKILVLKSVAQQNQYYVFKKIDKILTYSIVDMSLNENKGAVLEEKNIPFSTGVFDLFLTQGSDCYNYWLISTNITDSSFWAYRINETGIHPPIKSDLADMDYWKVVSQKDFASIPASIMHPDNQHLILTKYKDGKKFSLEEDGFRPLIRRINLLGYYIYNFNPITGIFTKSYFISEHNPQLDLDWISSLCFSPNGRFLYVSRILTNEKDTLLPRSPNSQILQYDFSMLPDTAAFKNSKYIVYASANDSFTQYRFSNQLRLAPNHKIYLTYSLNDVIDRYFYSTYFDIGLPHLSSINHPDEKGIDCNYEKVALTFPTFSKFPERNLNSSGKKIPANFYGYHLPNPTITQTFQRKNNSKQTFFLCQQNGKTIYISDDYDKVIWSDGTQNKEHHFTLPGIYWVYQFKDCFLTVDSFEFLKVKMNLEERDINVCKIAKSSVNLKIKTNIPGQINWSTGESNTEQITVTESGQYIVTIMNECGTFRDTAQVHFNEDCDCRPFIPNAFSPNHDGVNDIFKIQNVCPTHKFVLHIYNRMGQKVFLSYSIDNGWDGTFKGEALPVGTYYYYLDYESLNGLRYKLRGDLLLMR